MVMGPAQNSTFSFWMNVLFALASKFSVVTALTFVLANWS